MRTLWLVRHGESLGNVAASRAEAEGLEHVPIEFRDADVPLSAAGEEQARALGRWFADVRDGIGLCWSSPYLRAQQTLAIAAGDAPAPTVLDERLRDRELGVLDRLTWRGVERLHPEEAERRRHLGKFYHRPPGGESWADVGLRLRSVLRDILDGPQESALVVAHDAVVTLVAALLLAMPEQHLLRFAAEHPVLNASVTRLDVDPAGWRIGMFSDVTHLQQAGADVTAHQGSPDVQHPDAGRR